MKLAVVRILFPKPHMLLFSFTINISYPVGEERANILRQTSGSGNILLRTQPVKPKPCSFILCWSQAVLHPEKEIPLQFYFMVIFTALHKNFWLHNFLDLHLLRPMIPLKCEMYLKLAKATRFIPPLRFHWGSKK